MKIRNTLFLLAATSFVTAGVIGIIQNNSKTQEVFAAEPNVSISDDKEFADFIANRKMAFLAHLKEITTKLL